MADTKMQQSVFFPVYLFMVLPGRPIIDSTDRIKSFGKEAASSGVGLSGGITQHLSGSAAAALLIISTGGKLTAERGLSFAWIQDVLSKHRIVLAEGSHFNYFVEFEMRSGP